MRGFPPILRIAFRHLTDPGQHGQTEHGSDSQSLPLRTTTAFQNTEGLSALSGLFGYSVAAGRDPSYICRMCTHC